MSKSTEKSDDKTRCIQLRIGQPDSRDHTITTPFGRSQLDKYHLVFVVIDDPHTRGPRPKSSELLHKTQAKCRRAEARLMKKPHIRIDPNRQSGQRAILG